MASDPGRSLGTANVSAAAAATGAQSSRSTDAPIGPSLHGSACQLCGDATANRAAQLDAVAGALSTTNSATRTTHLRSATAADPTAITATAAAGTAAAIRRPR